MSDHVVEAAERTLFLRVEVAARLLGISRSMAYDMANRWLSTGGAEGLPAIRLGRRLLVKRSALDNWASQDFARRGEHTRDTAGPPT